MKRPSSSKLNDDYFRISDILTRRSKLAKRSKRAKTRSKILAATARELELKRAEPTKMTVAKIARAAGIAHGTFYLYFDTGSDAVFAVWRFYWRALSQFRPRGGGKMPAYEALLRLNKYYVKSYSDNAPLLRAFELLLRHRADYTKIRDYESDRWSRLVARDIDARLQNEGRVREYDSKLMARSSMALMDELLRERFVYESPTLRDLLPDDESVARLLTLAWYRLCYGKDPIIGNREECEPFKTSQRI